MIKLIKNKLIIKIYKNFEKISVYNIYVEIDEAKLKKVNTIKRRLVKSFWIFGMFKGNPPTRIAMFIVSERKKSTFEEILKIFLTNI